MALIRWEPKQEFFTFRELRSEVDRLFDEFFQAWARPPRVGLWALPQGERMPAVGVGSAPHVDLRETKTEFVLTAELPGLGREELEISLTGDSVTLKGEHRRESEGHGKQPSHRYRQIAYGSFQRVISLPGEIDPRAAKARLTEGVLTLTLPKAERRRHRPVTVEVE